jgi:hypothetical protein
MKREVAPIIALKIIKEDFTYTSKMKIIFPKQLVSIGVH